MIKIMAWRLGMIKYVPALQVYTRDEVAKKLAAIRWQELQWAHMNMRLRAGLKAQEQEVIAAPPLISKHAIVLPLTYL